MDTDRFNRWSRSLALRTRRTPLRTQLSPSLETIAKALSVGASRRSVLGALVAALLAPWLPIARAAAGQEETCRGSDCSCDCPDPICFLRSWGAAEFGFPNGVGVARDGTMNLAAMTRRIRTRVITTPTPEATCNPGHGNPPSAYHHEVFYLGCSGRSAGGSTG
jgi:hypothetical protein